MVQRGEHSGGSPYKVTDKFVPLGKFVFPRITGGLSAEGCDRKHHHDPAWVAPWRRFAILCRFAQHSVVASL
jgi:hypothetical protein